MVGGIVLARLLSPSEFGFYAVVGLFLVLLGVFGGTGFAGNLIRISDEPTLESCRAVFTAQQILVVGACTVTWFASPWIADLYHLYAHGIAFFRLTAASLFLTSLMVIPQVRMERHLEFDKLAIIEVCQAISFNAVAVFLAWRGYGILAFAMGLVVRSAIGAVLANAISPWKLRFHWDLNLLRSHIVFGVTLQASQLLAMAKDSITPLFIGLYLGTKPMGYAAWAMTFASYATILLVPLQRLYLPFFAQLQDDQPAIARFVPRVLWITNAIAAPLTVLSIALARPITSTIFGPKWLVALPLFYCFASVNITAPTVTPLMGLLNALGKPQQTLKVILLATIAIWALGVPLILYVGILGFGIAVIAASLVNIVLYRMVWVETRAPLWSSFWPAWPISIFIGAVVFFAQRALPIHDLGGLVAYGLTASVVYGFTLWFGFPTEIRGWLRLLRGV